MTSRTPETDHTLNAELIASMWREHAECNWVSDGYNVRWTCGIVHPGPIHMQPTTRDRHFAALLETQIEAERVTARRAEQQRFLDAARKRLDAAKWREAGWESPDTVLEALTALRQGVRDLRDSFMPMVDQGRGAYLVPRVVVARLHALLALRPGEQP